MELFIEKSKEKFGNIFDYSELNYVKTTIPIQLKCTIHCNVFTSTSINHLDTKYGGCKKCDYDGRFEILKNASIKKHGSDAFEIDKSTFVDQNIKVKIKCLKHNHVFSAFPSRHTRQKNGGCKLCTKINPLNASVKFINDSKEKFGDQFNYDDFSYKDSHTCGNIKCIKHDLIFEISPINHLRYPFGGCKKCMEHKNNDIKSKNDEELKLLDIDKCKNLYKVSNYGKIYSMLTNKYLKISKSEYCTIRLYNNDGTTRIYRVHRLVAHLFCENKDNKKFVDHINRVKDDNYYKNLRWVTHKENMNNKKKKLKKDKIKCEKITSKDKKSFIVIGEIEKYDFSDYMINKKGSIITKRNIILKLSIIGKYYHVSLQNKHDNKMYTIKVHRIVAHKFVTKPSDYNDTWVVNHIDNNKTNNVSSNLEWCTGKENTQKYFKKNICKIDIETNNILKIYSTFTEALNDLNIKYYSGRISKCCKGIGKTAFGFKWKLE